MALLMASYIHVTEEQLSYEVEQTTHPAEQGYDLTDGVKPGAAVLSLRGVIVGESADSKCAMFRMYMQKGSLLPYSGRNHLKDMQIASFETTATNDVWGGYSFSMTLRQAKIAKAAYVAPSVAAAQNTSSASDAAAAANSPGNAKAEIKAGDAMKLDNEPLYASSDAKNPANHVTGTYYVYDDRCILNRVVITGSADRVKKKPINNNAIGWVDVRNRGTCTSGEATAGTQQVQQISDDKKVYHTTKNGDTVWDLVGADNAPYKQYGFSVDDVLKNNPDAFSRTGDSTSLKTGVRLWVGVRS